LGFNGDLYPTAGATSVLTTKGDIVRYDTERERYGIGSAGQVLQVASSLPTWSTINLADSVLTTQGDVLYEGASALARLGQSTDNYTLATKGAGANPAWQASSTSTLSAAGDILYASGSNTLAKLAKASDGDTLQLASGVPAWVTVAAGGGSLELLNSEKLTTPTSSLQFTPSSALTPADYSAILVNAIVEPTNDGVFHKMTLNSETTGYYLDGIRTSAGTSSIQDNNDVESWRIKDETLEDEICISSTLIFIPNSSIPTDEYLSMMSQAFSIGRGFTSVGGYLASADENNIDNIYYAPQAGNWETGSTMTVYGVKRT